MKFPTVSVINSNLCAFGGPEGLTTVFGQFEGVEQDKIGGKSRNRGEHAEKRDLKLSEYGILASRLLKVVETFPT